MLRRSFLLSLSAAAAVRGNLHAAPPKPGANTPPVQRGGWIVVGLSGSPGEIGYQHGTALASEIDAVLRAVKLEMTHDTAREWPFFREAAKTMLWPRIESEYREEMRGIVAGLASSGSKIDILDIVALNAFMDLAPYYTEWLDRKNGKAAPAKKPAEHCSAFVATGSYTTDGRPVIAHNNWTDYATGERWNVIFDVRPAKGHRFLMDGLPGLIHSGDDFGVNAAGVMITETTIGNFHGFDPKGIPECVRARKAMQYASNIDDFAALMKRGNNGGYANTWLVADRKSGEIASLELGLKHVTLKRTHDGCFVGSNFPEGAELIRDETDFKPSDLSTSATARRIRWETLMAENKGRIDVELAKRFLGDHYDTFEKRDAPSERTICGHNEVSPRGMGAWQPPYGPAGAVQNKAADARLAGRLSFWAAAGHACGTPFIAAEHLAKHPELNWQKEILTDLTPGPWTLFEATE